MQPPKPIVYERPRRRASGLLRGGPRLAAVVPAHNEAATVAGVVRALKAARAVDEVIAVDDGSTDDTAAEAWEAGADRVIVLPVNGGKGQALDAAVATTRADALVTMDADLVGLRGWHVDALAAPVLAGEVAMHVGLLDRGALDGLYRLGPRLSGQRAMQRAFYDDVPAELRDGWAVETGLEAGCDVRGRCGQTVLDGVEHRRKTEKQGLIGGLASYVGMGLSVLDAQMRSVAVDGEGRSRRNRPATAGVFAIA